MILLMTDGWLLVVGGWLLVGVVVVVVVVVAVVFSYPPQSARESMAEAAQALGDS